MLVIICVIVIGFIFNVLSQDCGQLYFNGTHYSHQDGGIIRMPELLSSDLVSLPDIPHTCTFIITNLNAKGQIKLVFDDFLMYGGNQTSPSCDWPVNQDQLEVFDGSHSKAIPLFQSCFARHKRPPALMSTGNTMRIEYQHWSRFPGYPAFKVHYYFTNEPIWRNRPSMETDTRYKNGDSLLSSVLSVESALDMVWLVVAPPRSHVFLSLHTVQFQGVIWDPNVAFQVHDGLTSDSQLVHKFSKISLFSSLSIWSTKNALYLRWQSIPLRSGTVTVGGMYVFYTDLVDGGETCQGFACEASRRCISSKFECDGIDHCGNNDDENYCHACEGDFYCYNGGTCIPRSTGGYECQCQRGYSGLHCQDDESNCPDAWCNNGGSCRIIPDSHGYICKCRHGFTGTQCQIDNSCLASYCQNGGTCKGSHQQYYCECPAGFQGNFCEHSASTSVKYKDDSLASTLQYSLVVVVPSFVLLGLVWIGYRAKKGYCTGRIQSRHRGSFRDSFSADNPSSISRTVSRMNSTSTASSYADDPPPYHSVAGISPRSRGRLLSRTSISLQPCVLEEPPPSYETVITSLESCEVRIVPQIIDSAARIIESPRLSEETDGVATECALSQNSDTSEDLVYSTGSATSIDASLARDPLLPDVVNSGTLSSEVTDATEQCEENLLLKDAYIERATSL